jgi:hypothetical protein
LRSLCAGNGAGPRCEEALDAAKEATGVNRDLARVLPEAFAPNPTVSPDTLAAIFPALGQREGTIAATQEARGLLGKQ